MRDFHIYMITSLFFPPRDIDDLTFQSLDWSGHHLVEDVVGTLEGLLGDDTGLLQQICGSKIIMSWFSVERNENNVHLKQNVYIR